VQPNAALAPMPRCQGRSRTGVADLVGWRPIKFHRAVTRRSRGSAVTGREAIVLFGATATARSRRSELAAPLSRTVRVVMPGRHGPEFADDQRYVPSWWRESASPGDRSGAASRRLRRLCTTGAETASNAAPYGPATQIGHG
jgi:hypothetical protein